MTTSLFSTRSIIHMSDICRRITLHTKLYNESRYPTTNSPKFEGANDSNPVTVNEVYSSGGLAIIGIMYMCSDISGVLFRSK
jgi:hypothetical protein